jgi:DNA-binding response OmpR family regulator
MKILLVEDEAAIREVEAAYLADAGFVVTEASTGPQAISLFETQPFDLVLLDLNLPGQSGQEVCRLIRNRSMVPIIIVTALSEDTDELNSLGLGADDFLRKPFNPQVLVARVQRLLRRYSPGIIKSHDLTLDATAMLVTLAGRPINLTTTQFNILLTLAQHPGRVLSRNQLLEQAYEHPDGHDVYDRTIDAHIRSIRRALGDNPADPHYIQTVIGRGYRFHGGEHA